MLWTAAPLSAVSARVGLFEPSRRRAVVIGVFCAIFQRVISLIVLYESGWRLAGVAQWLAPRAREVSEGVDVGARIWQSCMWHRRYPPSSDRQRRCARGTQRVSACQPRRNGPSSRRPRRTCWTPVPHVLRRCCRAFGVVLRTVRRCRHATPVPTPLQRDTATDSRLLPLFGSRLSTSWRGKATTHALSVRKMVCGGVSDWLIVRAHVRLRSPARRNLKWPSPT